MATDLAEAVPDSTTATTGKSLTPESLLRYLAGGRDAILQVAESRGALWIGLLFVLSAAFAREYDGADLWHEPWHLALPLVASLGTSLVLYVLVFLAARGRGVTELNFVSGYRTLLTFYWWTAPLAWLYAVPVERFLSPGDATAINLWLLVAVSVWRVLLMTRVLSVWLRAGFVGMFFLVMLFADSVALLLAFFSPKPIFHVMGGVRLSQPDSTLLGAMIMVFVFGGLSWIVWLMGAVIPVGRSEPRWLLATVDASPRIRVSKPLWGVGALLLVFGIALLPFGQPEQQHRWQAERLLRSGEFEEAARYMAQLSREDFPPIWDPPPRVGYGEEDPSATRVLVAIEQQHDRPDWLRDLYVNKLTQDPDRTLWNVAPIDDDADPTEFERVLAVYEMYVPANLFDRQQWEDLWRLTSDDRIGEALRDRLRAYLMTADRRFRAEESDRNSAS